MIEKSNSPEVSIIIPTFNAEKYISRCIDSITASGLSESYYEIIAVDDFSTDKTLDILKGLEKNIPQLKVYFRRKSGPGGARNLGINYAKGRYIMFVDIDDNINSVNFAYFVKTLLPLYQQDIIGFDYLRTDESGNMSPVTKKIFPYCRQMTGSEYMNAQTPESVLWGYIYKRKFIIENSLKFIEKNNYDHEDFISRAFCLASSVTFLPIQIYYFHSAVEESLTNNPDEKHQEKVITDWLTIIEGLQKFLLLVGDPLSETGLTRKLNFVASDMITKLIYRQYDKLFIYEVLNSLAGLSLYPLAKQDDYGLRYKILRKVTATPDMVMWWRENKNRYIIRNVAKLLFAV